MCLFLQTLGKNDVITNNHYENANNNSNSSIDDDDDEPPPLPPPRGESLTRSMMSDTTPKIENNGNFLTLFSFFFCFVIPFASISKMFETIGA